jgi:hypothetical protein
MFRRTMIAAAFVAAPLAFAAPAMAAPSYTCSPCVNVPGVPGLSSGAWEALWPGRDGTGAWEQAQNGIWEKTWPGGDAKGSWEKSLPGSWEKATANAPMN